MTEPVKGADPETTTQAEVTPVEATQENINEVAKQVIAGYWGRGNQRKERLQAAGYDVAAVSEEISRIFKGS